MSMGNLNGSLIIGIGLLLCSLLFIVRLIAMKMHRDPISNKYKTGTPEYEAYLHFISPPKF
jgi:hypothetical protein